MPPPGQPYGGPPGQPFHQGPPQATTKSVVALVLGIAGLLLCGGLLGPAAIIVGHKALREIDSSNGRLGGRRMALAGLILGYIAVAFAVIVLIGVFTFPGLSD